MTYKKQINEETEKIGAAIAVEESKKVLEAKTKLEVARQERQSAEASSAAATAEDRAIWESAVEAAKEIEEEASKEVPKFMLNGAFLFVCFSKHVSRICHVFALTFNPNNSNNS